LCNLWRDSPSAGLGLYLSRLLTADCYRWPKPCGFVSITFFSRISILPINFFGIFRSSYNRFSQKKTAFIKLVQACFNCILFLIKKQIMATIEKKVKENYTLSLQADKCYHSYLKLKIATGEKICVACGETIS
jgi:hypothetical protein